MALDRNLSNELLSEIVLRYKFPDNLFTGSESKVTALKMLMELSKPAPAVRVTE